MAVTMLMMMATTMAKMRTAPMAPTMMMTMTRATMDMTVTDDGDDDDDDGDDDHDDDGDDDDVDGDGDGDDDDDDGDDRELFPFASAMPSSSPPRSRPTASSSSSRQKKEAAGSLSRACLRRSLPAALRHRQRQARPHQIPRGWQGCPRRPRSWKCSSFAFCNFLRSGDGDSGGFLFARKKIGCRRWKVHRKWHEHRRQR